MRKITVPAGIGDNIWLIQKLINTGEKFDFILPDGQPQRGHQIFELLPQVCNSVQYASGLSYSKLAAGNIQKTKPMWSQITEQSFFLAPNEWLESGRRIEGFFPDLPTVYALDYKTTEDDQLTAEIILDQPGKYIGIYATSYGNAEKGRGWLEKEWMEFIRMMYTGCSDFRFVIIGAQYDENHANLIMKLMEAEDIPFVNTIGQPLPVVVELLRRLTYFVGFPSGLSILNETLGKDGLMFYTKKDAGIINTWAEPSRFESGHFKECLYDTPEKIFNWIKNDYKLFQKL